MSETLNTLNRNPEDPMRPGINAARIALLGISDMLPAPISSHDIRVIARGHDDSELNPALFGLALHELIDEGHFARDERERLIRQDPQLQLDI